jgi:hypothetical protein
MTLILRKSVPRVGTITSNKIGTTSIPPTITVASGRCTWLLMPVGDRGRERARYYSSSVTSL